MAWLRRKPEPIDRESLDLAVRRLRNPQAIINKSELLPKVEIAETELRKAWAYASSKAVSQKLPIPKEAIAKEASPGLALYSITPKDIEAAMAAQGADWVSPFAPGRPLTPYVGYDGAPRSYDYLVGRNLNIEPRDGRIPYDVLKGVVEGYDIAMACIRYLIRDLQGMPLMFEGLDEASGPSIQKQIKRGKDFLRKPDGVNPWPVWLAKFGWDAFAYDCATIYKQRDDKGRVVALKVIEGQTITPMLNWLGDLNRPPAPAFQQTIMGVPWADFTTDDLIYQLLWPRPSTPYGFPPIESVLLNANTDMRMQAFFLQFFTSGAIPELLLVAPDTVTQDQLEQMQEFWDDLMQGDQTRRFGARFVPGAVTPIQQAMPKFDKDLWESIMRLTVSQYGLAPVNLGLTMDVNKATAGTQMDQQEQNSSAPNIEIIEAMLNQVLQEDLELEISVHFDDGRKKEDRLKEAQAYQIYINSGMISPEKAAEKILGLPFDPKEETPRFIAQPAVVPVTAIMSTSGHVDPQTGAPMQWPAPTQYEWPGAKGPPPPAPSSPPEAKPQAALPQANKAPVPQVPKAENFQSGSTSTVPTTPTYNAGQKTSNRRTPTQKPPVKKADGPSAGLIVYALDTHKVLLLQRGEEIDDTNQGAWEFPGGHLEPGESPWEAAVREWEEEVGVPLASTGYQLLVQEKPGYTMFLTTIPHQSDVNLKFRVVRNDALSGNFENAEWASVEEFSSWPNLRPELEDDRDLIVSVLRQVGGAVRKSREMQQFLTVSDNWFVNQQKPWREFVFKELASGPILNADLNVVKERKRGIRPTRQGPEAQALEIKAAVRIRRALIAMLDHGSLAREINRAKTIIGESQSPEVLDAIGEDAASKVRLNLDPIHNEMHTMALEGASLGHQEAIDQLPIAERTPEELTADMNFIQENLSQAAGPMSWNPGDELAAALVHDDTLLKPLRASQEWGAEIDRTTRKYIKEAIVEGLKNGSSVQTIGDQIEAQVGSLSRADTIATTEVNRYMTIASLLTYQKFGVKYVEFMTAFDPCPICAAIAADNPHLATDVAIDPPVHPNCRCALAPV